MLRVQLPTDLLTPVALTPACLGEVAMLFLRVDRLVWGWGVEALKARGSDCMT